MKRLVFLLALAAAVPANGQVAEETDRFTGERRLTYVSGAKTEFDRPKFAIRTGVNGINAVTFMYSPGLGRYALQRGMKFIGCRSIDWLIDGKPEKLGVVVHDAQRIDRLTMEFLNQEVTVDQLAAIGNASSVEYRLCGSVTGTLTAADIGAARDIASRLAAR